MVNFENGALEKGAYVLINGIEYPVVMPKCSGKTPITAENLNKLQNDIYERLNKGTKNACITARINEDLVLTGNTATRLNLNTIVKNNSDFDLGEEGAIICPFNGTVLVTASAMFSPRKGYCGLAIYNDGVEQANHHEPAGTQTYGCIEMANKPIEVRAGSALHLYVQTDTANDKVVANNRTRMTVMYIDYEEV